jgi:mandelamide amidase
VPAALCGIVGLAAVGRQWRRRTPLRRRQSGGPISHTRDTVGPMGRTVADVALLDSVITAHADGDSRAVERQALRHSRVVLERLDRDLEAVAGRRAQGLPKPVVLVDVDMPGLFEQNAKVSFPVALHEPIADIPAYLEASGITGVSLADIAAKIVSPDVKGAFGAITADAFGAAYSDAINVHRPALQKIYRHISATTIWTPSCFRPRSLPRP